MNFQIDDVDASKNHPRFSYPNRVHFNQDCVGIAFG